MSFTGIAPGNILQNLYLKERIQSFKSQGLNSFLEIGAGNGFISKIFLDNGFYGTGIDLNQSACENNLQLNKNYYDAGIYQIKCVDFFDFQSNTKFDIIISYMVIEHLSDNQLSLFFQKAKSLLNDNGYLIIQVPASMKYWGIEDEIAGHMKRYEYQDFHALAQKHHLLINHLCGLTYPLSNWLFKLSNKIIEKNEKDKLNLTQKERTVYTGNRQVPYKTKFPKIFNLILNPVVLYPFHILQKLYKHHPDCMIIYAEFKNSMS